MRKREFNLDEPIAYFITWTTYGTWLPGDERGWNRKRERDLMPADPVLEQQAKDSMKEHEFVLCKNDRDTVEQTIRKHCQIRAWELHAINARSNHVHVIVTAPEYKPETVADQFKAWCTRNLKSTHPDRERFWTERSSQRWINHDDDLESAIVYVIDGQDNKYE